MCKAALITCVCLVMVAGCGDDGSQVRAPSGGAEGLYVICSGKPRYCAVADTREAMPSWRASDELDPDEAARFRRLVGPAPAPQRPG